MLTEDKQFLSRSTEKSQVSLQFVHHTMEPYPRLNTNRSNSQNMQYLVGPYPPDKG